jgi:hypothetical protein
MKKTLTALLVVGLVSAVSFAGDLLPSAGVNFGWTFPASKSLSDSLNSSFNIGVFARVNSIVIPYTDLVLDVGYTSLPNKNNSDYKMSFIPITLSGEFSPIPDFGLLPYLKLGGGIVFETLKQASEETNTDPIFLGGLGARMKIADKLVLKVEGVYSYIYQKYISGATEDGALISVGAGISYQF